MSQHTRYGPLGAEIVNFSGPGTGTSRGYHSATVLRESGISLGSAGSADTHLRHDLDLLRRQSQAFDRNNGIYQAMLTRMADVILGDGMTLQSKCKNKKAGDKVEGLWNGFWAGKPEVRGLDSGAEVERMLLRHLWVDGDVSLIKVARGGLVQTIEAEQIDSQMTRTLGGRRIELGVELDGLNKPAAYYVAPYNNYGTVMTSSAKRKPADEIIYLANRRRASQTRGEPVMQCNFAMFHRLNDVCDSEAIAWQLMTKMALAIIRKDAEVLAEATSEADPNTGDADFARRIHDLTEALIVHLEPGEDVKGIERNIPGQNFTESIKTFLRLLGMPFGLSLEFVLLIWSDTNYSSGRASIKQVERACRPWIGKLRTAMGEIYRWKVRQWVREKKVKWRSDLDAHEFFVHPYPFIDPQKEAAAQTERLEAGLTSPTREAKAVGLDDEELVNEQADDIERRIVAAEQLNEKHPGAGITAADFTKFIEPRRSKADNRQDAESAKAKKE